MERDVIEVLASEHAELHSLFERVSGQDENRPKILKQLMQDLSNHVAMEKQLLVPALRHRAENGQRIADQLTDEHDRIERHLTLLERRKAGSPDVPRLVTELLDINAEHIITAETVIFPALRAALTGDELNELGKTMVSDERSLLTRSHPSLPDSGPIAAVTRRAAELVDRIRDHSTTSSGSAQRWPTKPPEGPGPQSDP